MRLFQSYELMSVVVGNEDYDWMELENQAEYKHGYRYEFHLSWLQNYNTCILCIWWYTSFIWNHSSGDKTIRMFWEVFHDLPVAEKKNFLLYLTGSDRIPVQGMKAIKVIMHLFLLLFHILMQFIFVLRSLSSLQMMTDFCQLLILALIYLTCHGIRLKSACDINYYKQFSKLKDFH